MRLAAHTHHAQLQGTGNLGQDNGARERVLHAFFFFELGVLGCVNAWPVMYIYTHVIRITYSIFSQHLPATVFGQHPSRADLSAAAGKDARGSRASTTQLTFSAAWCVSPWRLRHTTRYLHAHSKHPTSQLVAVNVHTCSSPSPPPCAYPPGAYATPPPGICMHIQSTPPWRLFPPHHPQECACTFKANLFTNSHSSRCECSYALTCFGSHRMHTHGAYAKPWMCLCTLLHLRRFIRIINTRTPSLRIYNFSLNFFV